MKRSEMTCANCVKGVPWEEEGEWTVACFAGPEVISVAPEHYCWQGLWENPQFPFGDVPEYLCREDGEK